MKCSRNSHSLNDQRFTMELLAYFFGASYFYIELCLIKKQ